MDGVAVAPILRCFLAHTPNQGARVPQLLPFALESRKLGQNLLMPSQKPVSSREAGGTPVAAKAVQHENVTAWGESHGKGSQVSGTIAVAAITVDLRPQPVCSQPGGGVPQREQAEGPAPAAVIANRQEGNPAGYRERARHDGIAFRPHGLFPPNDALLARLAATAGCWPFEKHLPGAASPYEALPRGGWITGDAAVQRGVDLRLFYQPPEASGHPGTVVGAVRFGNGAAIGVGFHLSAHGGACETVLDEATAELGKCEFQPFLSTREATFSIKRPVPLHTTLGVRCWITQRKGIRCWVEGRIESEDGSVEFATATAQLVDMTHFI